MTCNLPPDEDASSLSSSLLPPFVDAPPEERNDLVVNDDRSYLQFFPMDSVYVLTDLERHAIAVLLTKEGLEPPAGILLSSRGITELILALRNAIQELEHLPH